LLTGKLLATTMLVDWIRPVTGGPRQTWGALFLPGAKYERSPLVQGASLVSETPHIGKAPGVGTGDGGGVLKESGPSV